MHLCLAVECIASCLQFALCNCFLTQSFINLGPSPAPQEGITSFLLHLFLYCTVVSVTVFHSILFITPPPPGGGWCP